MLKFIYFNWRVIALQCCDGLCHTSTWIGHRYTWVPTILNTPPTSPATLSLRVVPEPGLWGPCCMHGACAAHLCYLRECTCFRALLSSHPTLANCLYLEGKSIQEPLNGKSFLSAKTGRGWSPICSLSTGNRFPGCTVPHSTEVGGRVTVLRSCNV